MRCPKKVCRVTRATRQERILKNKKFKERTEEEPTKPTRVEAGKFSVLCAKGIVPKGETPQLSSAVNRLNQIRTEKFLMGLATRGSWCP